MSDIAIKFENISKQYRLGKIGTGTLSHDLNRWWAMNIRGKEDPNLKIGQVNDRASKSTEDYVWALRNIDFEVKQGEILGIIGKNGAGKSTLLKILSRVTTPTTGRITAYGRIASLLEVGTGFHPEMTGRENIYMNGTIMGMRRWEIDKKLEEIVEFAGVAKYIDTPVKRYSSGMTVRLGFAIAAHLEPEILVVDEVLAVGDAEFQKKAIGKMQDVSRNDGRTVLFVSHNMANIQNLCTQGLLLKNGHIDYAGEITKVIDRYLILNPTTDITNNLIKKYHSTFQTCFVSIILREIDTGVEKNTFRMGEKILLEIDLSISEKFNNLSVNVRLDDIYGTGIAAWRMREKNLFISNKQGQTKVELIISDLNIFDGIYTLSFSLSNGNEVIDSLPSLMNLEIIPADIFDNGIAISKSLNLIYTPCEWLISYL